MEKETYNYYQSSLEKFDYFILGIIVVVCGFLTKEINFAPIGLNIETMQLCSLLIFGISGIASFKRSEYQIQQYKFNYIQLVGRRIGSVESEVLTEDKLNRILRKSYICYVLRNSCLVAGFLIYILSKVLGAYVHA